MTLPDELLALLRNQYPFRDLQLRALSTLYAGRYAAPPNLVVYGPDATGKSTCVRAVLSKCDVSHAIVDCSEMVTGRHLLEKTIAACLDALDSLSDTSFDPSDYTRTESLSALMTQLQSLLEGKDKFVLVFDNVDRQREAPPTLLPALARLGEIIHNLSVVFITTNAASHSYSTARLPHLYFSPYSRTEVISILAQNPPRIFTNPISPSLRYSEEDHKADSVWVWTRFCGAVWDSLGKNAARDVVSLRSVCDRLWRPFVSSIEDRTFGTRDFSKLMVAKKALLQRDDALIDTLIPMHQSVTAKASANSTSTPEQINGAKDLRDLPYYSRYILCAAYIASYNPSRQDHIYFTHLHEKKRRRKVSSSSMGGGGAAVNRVGKRRHIPRHLLNPSPFPLERLLAILRAIVPDTVPQTADLLTQVSTLTSLRLLVRAGVVGGDVLEAGARWRANFGWRYAQMAARSVRFGMEDYMAVDV